MQMLALSATTPSNTIPTQGTVCHDVRNPLQRSEVLFRKGSLIGAAEFEALLERGIIELHVAVPTPDDVGEDDAAVRLAAAISGNGVSAGTAHFGQVTLTSNVRGLVGSLPLRNRAGGRPGAVRWCGAGLGPRALGEFGATVMFAGQFQGRTQTMPLAIYAALETDLDAALGLSILLLGLSFALLALFRHWLQLSSESG